MPAIIFGRRDRRGRHVLSFARPCRRERDGCIAFRPRKCCSSSLPLSVCVRLDPSPPSSIPPFLRSSSLRLCPSRSLPSLLLRVSETLSISQLLFAILSLCLYHIRPDPSPVPPFLRSSLPSLLPSGVGGNFYGFRMDE